MEILFGILYSILNVFSLTWWLILPLILFYIFHNVWLIYIKQQFLKKIEWTTLEVRVPKDILKTPKAMEQVFSAMYGNYSHGNKTVYIYTEGKQDEWFSFEIVGHAGGVHFYLHIPAKLRNMVESAIFSEYPEAEIHEVEDYTQFLPETLPNKSYNLWGTDLELSMPSYFPIRTHFYFEESIEERVIDPISTITEILSTLKGEGQIWFQITFSPSDEAVGNFWKKEGDEAIDKIMGKKSANKGGIMEAFVEWLINLFKAPVIPPTWAEEKKPDAQLLKFLNPAEQETVKAIYNKTAKLGFEANIRFIYIDRRETFSTSYVSGFMSTIRQFNTQNLNSLKTKKTTTTLVTGWKSKFIPGYQDMIEYARKKSLWFSYRQRRLGNRLKEYYRNYGEKMMTLNIEELATIYHFPTTIVGAPKLRRMESKKGGPPVGLPIEEL